MKFNVIINSNDFDFGKILIWDKTNQINYTGYSFIIYVYMIKSSIIVKKYWCS